LRGRFDGFPRARNDSALDWRLAQPSLA
jgi:hypothetical protein